MRSRRAAAQLVIGWLTLLWMGTDLFVVSPLLPAIARQYQVTPALAGTMVAIFAVGYALMAPLFGTWADHTGQRAWIVAGLMGFGLANALTAWGPSFGVLLVARAWAGVSAAAVTPSLYAIASETAPAHGRATWIAVVGTGLVTALAVGAPAGTLLSRWIGWHGVFFGIGGMALAFAGLNSWVWPAGVPKRQRSRLVLSSAMLRSVAATVAWGTAMYGTYTYLGTWLRLTMHQSAHEVAAILGTYGIGALVGSLIVVRFNRRWPPQRWATAAMAGLAVWMAGFWVALRLWPGPNAFLLAVFGWATLGYIFFPSHQARLTEDFPEQRGSVLAWNNSALYAGIMLGVLSGGMVAAVWSYAALPLWSAGVAVVSALLSLRGGRPAMLGGDGLTVGGDFRVEPTE